MHCSPHARVSRLAIVAGAPRSSFARALLLAVYVLALGCAPAVGFVAERDTGARRVSDAGPVPSDAPEDAPSDAPQPAPVHPPQFWEALVERPELPSPLRIAIAIDARAETGGVRTVVGANGESASVWFDTEEPGLLRARSNFDVGIYGEEASGCIAMTVRVSSGVLLFEDGDDDGTTETLVELRGSLSFVARDGTEFWFADVVAPAVPDETPPTLVAVPPDPLGEMDLVLFSSEPLDASFAPYLDVDGVRLGLRETSGGGATRWTLAASALPTTIGTLGAASAPRDLAGHAGVLPDFTFVPSPLARPDTVVVDPLFETSIVGVSAEGVVRVLEGEEVPIQGERSVFAEGRTLILLTPRAFAEVGLGIGVRVHGNDVGSEVHPLVRVFDERGDLLGAGERTVTLDQPSTVAGLASQSSPTTINVAFPRMSADGTVLIEIVPQGAGDTACGPGPEHTDELAMTIDSIFTF